MIFLSVLKSVARISVGTGTIPTFLQAIKQSAMCSVMDFNAQLQVSQATKKYPQWEACVPCQEGRFKNVSGNQEPGVVCQDC